MFKDIKSGIPAIVKVVRDNLKPRVDKIEQVTPANSRAGKQMGLLLKAHEEVQEIARAPGDPSEYADLRDTMEELMYLNGVTEADVEKARDMKSLAKGKFRKGLVWLTEEGATGK